MVSSSAQTSNRRIKFSAYSTYRNSTRRRPRRSAIQIILLHIDAIDRDAAERDILIRDVIDGARSAGVRLDPRAVLRVEDLAVFEHDAVDCVVGLAAHGADGEAVAAYGRCEKGRGDC